MLCSLAIPTARRGLLHCVCARSCSLDQRSRSSAEKHWPTAAHRLDHLAIGLARLLLMELHLLLIELLLLVLLVLLIPLSHALIR